MAVFWNNRAFRGEHLPYFGLSIRYICFISYPRENNPHSVDTLALPRNKNLRYPRFPFIWPNTVSTSTDPCFRNSLCFSRALRDLACNRRHFSFYSTHRFPFVLLQRSFFRQYVQDSPLYASWVITYPEGVFSFLTPWQASLRPLGQPYSSSSSWYSPLSLLHGASRHFTLCSFLKSGYFTTALIPLFGPYPNW